MTVGRDVLLNSTLLLTLLVLTVWSLTIGPLPLSVADVMSALFSTASSTSVDDLLSETDLQTRYHIIVTEIRLPRALLAVLVGSSLGMSGAALQGLLRNPLADPGLLGVSASASLGAVLCLYFGLSGLNLWLLPVSAMVFAAASTLLLALFARRSSGNLVLILAGIGLSSLTGALISLAINLAPTPTDVQDIVLWLLGSIADRSFDDILLCLPFVLAGLCILMASGRGLNALTLGDEEAASLGVNLVRLRLMVIIGTALCVGASVAVAGAIGFIGLVVPHMLRKATHYHPARLLIASALGGAVLLLAADIVLRLVSQDFELMLGVVTSLIGAPFFLLLIMRTHTRGIR
ncbi:FecCD family ABC transporter permease [Granulosicoccus antarcticus]|uniref:Hemin transport system permease protein HmuU n=1 Tax=Granulosicoccus antarcticus IMCC3135 TaxID=1192854 RepID=A0A2Z2NMT7_9GAMM|nr:iron ABC transporter permease [Granulosicoccus antarcticus]ASJ71825.1 Hemin transport system permease protein HmuU [Granulosicoccus antarcticus IMCC3135]